ncbi:hypothetical protein TrLO_g11485 [Triparma laevis f. longispina]|uniref:Uncharacterized protein n=1 Tax=Triparma laevis f. longispina TaxID=1714387 RepID=A0A9W7C9U9_9STRA|nr:hypothetical protein TrLO_g11485 [Triparma laevis f. longispina]
MDGNFEIILSKYSQRPGDPYFRWISRAGGWEKRRQISKTPLLVLLGAEFFTVCTYMGWKGELFGSSLIGSPTPFANYVGPFMAWTFYYILVCEASFLAEAAPMELGPEVFAGVTVWRLLTNGGLVYLALGKLGGEHYLSLEVGMMGYGVSLALAAFGLFLFMMNCDVDFVKSLFWRPKTGKEYLRGCWRDEKIWFKEHATKDDDGWYCVGKIHPTYLPFDEVTPWSCVGLVGKWRGGTVMA